MKPLKPVCKLITLLIFFGISCASAQQGPSAKKWKPYSVVSAGLITGQLGASSDMQVIHGLGYHNWFLGLGTGLDYYRFRGIPVFIDLRKEFGHAKIRPFLYTQGGIQFNWLTANQKAAGTTAAAFSNGFYYGAGGGYKWAFNAKNALLLSAGYSYKHVRTTGFHLYPNLMAPEPLGWPINYLPSNTMLDYQLNRFVFRVGWSF